MGRTRAFKRDCILSTSCRAITAASLAWRYGVTRRSVDEYCRAGRFVGAWFDPITWQWWIPLPVIARR